MIFNNPRTAIVLTAAFAMTLSACAASARPDISSFLVRQGEPTVSYDAGDSSAREATKPQKIDSPASTDHAMRERTDPGLTVEGTDQRLRQALGKLRAADTPSNRVLVAAAYRRLRILDKAYDHLTLALQSHQRSAEMFEQRAQIWREWGFPQLGLGDAYRAVYMAPRSPSARNTLGTLLQSTGDQDAARRAYLRVLELDPGAAYASSNLCYLSLVTGHAGRAATECADALREQPELLVARNNLALSYAATGRLQEAREVFSAVGSPADAAFNIGMLYLAVGKYHLAEESFGTATDLRQNFSAAKTRRQQAAGLAVAASKRQ